MRKIRINKYSQRDRQQLQERIAASVERDPEPYLQKYTQDPRSHEGRYVSSDLMKETIPEYAASNEARARYSNPLHNSAAVLAAEQYSRIVNDHSHPERDQAIFLTGIPGAGKTTAVLTGGEPPGQLPNDVRVVYEGPLSNPETSIPKIREAIDAGLVPTIVAVNTLPETALQNTLNRFESEGRGASIHAMATIQSELPDALRRIHEQFGDQANLVVIDRSSGMNNSTELSGWEHPNRLQEGTYEQLKDRLQSALEQQFAENRNAFDGYRQAVGLPTIGLSEGLHNQYGQRVEQLQTADEAEVAKLQSELLHNPEALGLPVQFTPALYQVEKFEQAAEVFAHLPSADPAENSQSNSNDITDDDDSGLSQSM
jgi:hypothetical protein